MTAKFLSEIMQMENQCSNSFWSTERKDSVHSKFCVPWKCLSKIKANNVTLKNIKA